MWIYNSFFFKNTGGTTDALIECLSIIRENNYQNIRWSENSNDIEQNSPYFLSIKKALEKYYKSDKNDAKKTLCEILNIICGDQTLKNCLKSCKFEGKLPGIELQNSMFDSIIG